MDSWRRKIGNTCSGIKLPQTYFSILFALSYDVMRGTLRRIYPDGRGGGEREARGTYLGRLGCMR